LSVQPPDGQGAGARPAGGIRTRVITALVMGVVLLAVLLYGPPAAMRVLLAAFIAAGAWEWAAFMGPAALRWRPLYVLAVAMAALLLRHYTVYTGQFAHVMLMATLWWFVAFSWILVAPPRAPPWAAALAGLLALVPAWLALARISETWPHGRAWTIFVLALAFAADIGAFFAGRAFGRVKLAPRVSPGKTWEGVFGGLALALAVGWLASALSGVPASRLLPLAAVGAGFSVVGDLTESLFKRSSGLKDSGTLIPGHGGVLDRIDSTLAATPVLALGLLWLGVGL
jgi:phosphatidate cytidylyltransferase